MNLIPFLLLILLLAFNAFADELQTGTYQIRGYVPGVAQGYEGKALIYQEGNAYVLDWFVEHKKLRYGTGFLDGSSFSANYTDDSRDVGVLNLRVARGQLKGRWVSAWNPDQVHEIELTLIREELPDVIDVTEGKTDFIFDEDETEEK